MSPLNWDALDGVNNFIILRAVRAVDTSQTKGEQVYISVVDKNFDKNWSALAAKKIPRGAYHFFAPNVSAEEQFELFKKSVQLQQGDLPPIVDIENRNCDMDEVIKWLELAKAHYKVTPILYTDYFFYKTFLAGKNKEFPLWLYYSGDFLTQPTFKDPDCVIWQYAQDQKIAGFNEKVDLNVFLGDEKAFQRLLIK